MKVRLLLRSGRAWVFGLSLLLSPDVARASHNILADGDFDTSIAGWTFDMGTDTTLEWDGSVGNPSPGSLRIAGNRSGAFANGYALSECFEPPPGVEFTVRARVLAQTDGAPIRCVPYISDYQEAGCGGFRDLLTGSPSTSNVTPGVWTTLSWTEQITSSHPSFRVGLYMVIPAGAGSASCNFDSVELFVPGTAPVVEIPAASNYGRILLGLSLALAAVWAMRRGA